MRFRVPTLLLALVILSAPSAVAQIGVAGGGIYSDASVSGTDSEIDTESRTGFQVGVSYATGGTLGVIFGGYYSEKGFNVQDSSDRVKLSYIEVPVMAVVRLPVIGRAIGPRLYGGVNGGFETSCDSSLTGDDPLAGLCDDTNSFDFGLKAGLGVQVFMFGLDLAYVHGLTDVAKSETLDVKNRTWSLALLIGVG